jgi:phenylacetaldehyde dehydrogenase
MPAAATTDLGLRPAPSPEALAFLARPHRLLIGGRWRDGRGSSLLRIENPAREQEIATIAPASLDDVDDAVRAARAALDGEWGRLGGRDRARILFRFADLLDRHAPLIAEVMTLDNGSPLTSSLQVVKLLAAELFRYYGGWATKIEGSAFAPTIGHRTDVEFLTSTLREPVGVVGAIVPWNAPPGMLALKLAPALAAGCAVVVKTAELAPLVGESFAELWLEAGGPAGAFNLLHGAGEDVGAAMASHPGVDKLAFTGSTSVGKRIVAAATGNLKRVTLELGGKSPVIVFPDADLESAIPAASMACFLSTGQACMAGTRLFVHADVYDEVATGVAAHASRLVVGDGLAPDTMLGPLISARQKARVETYVRAGIEDGATPLTNDRPAPSPGHFLRPVVFRDATPGMRIAREEIFGPVLSVLRFHDEAELLAAVNGTSYALSGSVWTRDVQRAYRIARRVDAGQVGINVHSAMSPEIPFGGNRQSGWGREFGREGLEPYLKTKAITLNIGPRP